MFSEETEKTYVLYYTMRIKQHHFTNNSKTRIKKIKTYLTGQIQQFGMFPYVTDKV